MPSPASQTSLPELDAFLKHLESRVVEVLPADQPKLPYGCDKCDGYGNLVDEYGARHCKCKLDYFARNQLLCVSVYLFSFQLPLIRQE